MEQHRTTVSLCWRDESGVHTRQASFSDQAPQDLIPKLLHKIGLPTLDQANDQIAYRLRLDSEGGAALKPRDLLSTQNVYEGSRLWLVTELGFEGDLDKRCLLQLPDGTEVVIPPRGQHLQRKWLLRCVELHNPAAYWQELSHLEARQSAYSYVSSTPHCTISASDHGGWVVMTERSDVVTEWTTDREFDRVRQHIPQPLFDRTRLRLGGSAGIEVGVVLL